MLTFTRLHFFVQLFQVFLLLGSINDGLTTIPIQYVSGLVSSSTYAQPRRSEAGVVLKAIPHKKKNKVYKHLFRHYDDIGFDSWLRCTDPYDFLYSVGFNPNEIDQMCKDYPPLLEQNTHMSLAPKIRFLVETMGGGSGTLMWTPSSEENRIDYKSHDNDNGENEECFPFQNDDDDLRSHHTMRLSPFVKSSVPAWFFGCNLDRLIGPRHAYLVQHNLPHSSKLLHEYNGELFLEFLRTCHDPDNNKQQTSDMLFLNLCHKWETALLTKTSYSNFDNENNSERIHTEDRFNTFVQLFGPGLLPATRAMVPFSNNNNNMNSDETATGSSSRITVYPDKLVNLLVTHGSNYLEYDTQGMLPLHWAAATGKVLGVQTLLRTLLKSSSPPLLEVETMQYNIVADFILGEVDTKGATSFHWACCGILPGRRIGSGGSMEICRTMLEHCGQRRGDVANAKTFSKSTPLMWASWASPSPSLDNCNMDDGNNLAIIELLVMHGADPHAKDNKGRSAAHWAAAAGNINVCRYLHESLGVDFNLGDDNDITPLDYANSFNRRDVLELLDSTVHGVDGRRIDERSDQKV